MTSRFAWAFVAAVFLASSTTDGRQADRSRTEALAQRAADRLKTLREEADRLASQERTLRTDLRRVEIDRQIKLEEFQQADAAAARSEQELRALDTQIEQLERQD